MKKKGDDMTLQIIHTHKMITTTAVYTLLANRLAPCQCPDDNCTRWMMYRM